MKQPKQEAGTQYRFDPALQSRPPGKEERKRRNWAVGHNEHYEYAVGMNLVVLTGKVTRPPRIAGLKNRESLWFRMSVPNQDNPKQWLFISVRCRAKIAIWAWQNIHRGDIVAVTGRLYSGKLYRPPAPGLPKVYRLYPYVIAERLSSSYPVQLEEDSRYVRVRRDLLNRISQVLPEMDLTDVSAKQKEKLLRRLAQAFGEPEDALQPEVSPEGDLGDPDPTSNPEPKDDPPCAS